MRSRHWMACLACLAFLAAAPRAQAQTTPDPLRLVPVQADLVVKVEHPRKLVEGYFDLYAFQQLQKIDAVREALDSTNARRFYQLIGYFEEKLGAGKYELIDKVAGGGVVLASKVGGNPAPALLVLQGTDRKTAGAFFDLALQVLDEELARQQKGQKVERKDYNGIPLAAVGDDAYLGLIDGAIVATNKKDVMKVVVEMHLKKANPSVLEKESLAEAKKALPKNPDAWLWFNMEPVHASKEGMDFFKNTVKDQPFIAVTAFGGMFEVASRSPFIAGALTQQPGGYRATLRFPAGREGMYEKTEVFFPEGNDGALPLLEPADVFFSTSYILDPARVWKDREKVLDENALKQLAKAEQNSGRFLGGTKLGQILEAAGPHQRVVVTQRTGSVYDKKPEQNIPAFAVVHDMRDPKFGRTLDRVLRTAAILGAAQFNLKLVEEEVGGVTVVSYRFPEDREVKQDKQDIRFAFSPSFAEVGDQFVVSSTVELARELVGLLRKEKDAKPARATLQARVYSSGIAAGLRETRDQLVAQFVLAQALDPAEARKQVDTLIDLVEHLGTLRLETVYNRNDTQLNIDVRLGQAGRIGGRAE